MTDSRYQFLLPDLGEGVTEAEIRAWKVAVGDRVEEHQVIAEIETDKALVEVPTPKSGIVSALGGEVGDRIAVGAVLLELEQVDGAVQEPSEQDDAGGERPESFGIVGVLPESGPLPESQRKPRKKTGTVSVEALPRVRQLARQLGVDLTSVHGTGPQGRILEQDVRAAAGESAGSETDVIPFKGLRRRVAQHLQRARDRTVQVTVTAEADAGELVRLKLNLEQELAEGMRLTYLPLFMKLTQLALAEFPILNAELDEDAGHIRLHRGVHLGIALDSPEGLLVPVVRDVQHRSILELAGELEDLVERGRRRALPASALTGSTFTLTNFGAFGTRFATPVLNHPNVGILGFGALAERPWAVAGQLVVRPVLPLSLTFDHRVLDGAEASRFLSRVVDLIEHPERAIIRLR
ncbi:MAG: dihydrolipoamide acetyltransferase family protein [Geothermobacteraceae bacterium]